MNKIKNILSFTFPYIALLSSLFLVSPAALAEEPASIPVKDVTLIDPEKLEIRAGAFIIRNADTNLVLVGQNSGVGVALDLDSALGLNSSADSPRLDIQYKFTPEHGINFSYYPVNRKGSKVLLQDIIIDGEVFLQGAEVSTTFNTASYNLAYNYTLFNHNKIRLDAKAGLNITTFQFGINSKSDDLNERFVATAPLPTFGFTIKYKVYNKLYLRTNWELFFLSYEEYSGTQTEMSLSLEHQTFKSFGFGAGINKYFLKLNLDQDDFAGTIENSYTGYLVYMIYKY